MVVPNLDALASSGATLNVEERAALSVSIPLLKDAQQSQDVGFWGKILGVQKDYYIAWSGKSVGTSGRKWFFSHDARTWQVLPQVSAAEEKALDVVAGQKFLGDPAFEYEHDSPWTRTRPCEYLAQKIKTQGKAQIEEKRVAQTVKKIEHEAGIAPRGAFIQTADGNIVKNASFTGLQASDSKNLKSWLHVRRDNVDRSSENIVKRENLDAAQDIFENLEADKPTGTWSLRSEKGDSLVLARNLAWPGSVAYHQTDVTSNSAQWGWMYIGQGTKNVELGFMV